MPESNKQSKPALAEVASADLLAKGNAVIVGDIYVVDDPESERSPEEIKLTLVIQFESAEDVKKAMKDRKCTFAVLGG